MARPFTYMPVLKWKKGESSALKELFAAEKQTILPLAEITPVPWDWDEDVPSEDLDTYLRKVARVTCSSWGTDDEVLVDLSILLNDSYGPSLPPLTHPLTFLFEEFRRLNVKAIPVAHGDEGVDFQAAMRSVLALDNRGLALRLQEPLLFDEDLPRTVGSCLSAYGLTPEQVDVILDLQYIEPGRERAQALVVQTVVNTFPHLQDWRSFSLAASAFPKDLSGIPDFSTSNFPRAEWLLWSIVRSGKVPYARTPTFADYAINHAEFEDVDPRAMIANGNIRYTIDSDWLYIKGTILRDLKRMGVVIKKSPGFAQFVGLAKTLVAHPSFSGPTFSSGDQQVDDVANGRSTTGNLMTWRKVGTNHHITFVVRQIASSSWPSSSAAPIP